MVLGAITSASVVDAMYITPPVALTAVSKVSDSSKHKGSSDEDNSASSSGVGVIGTRSAGTRENSSCRTIGTRSYNIE